MYQNVQKMSYCNIMKIHLILSQFNIHLIKYFGLNVILSTTKFSAVKI